MKLQKYLAAVFLFGAVHARGGAAAEFPLMAWDYASDERTLGSMHECGINLIAFARTNMLEACAQNGIKAIVYDDSVSALRNGEYDGDRARTNLPALIASVNNNPAVYGYHIIDEPDPREFPELAKGIKVVEQLAPGKWPYVNLLPGAGPAYDQMVDNFVATCQPTALSYDRYSIVDSGFDSGFWGNLAQMRDAALRHHLPFWNIVLTSPHWHYRQLTPADIRMQVWGSLAYGVSGLSFYKFVSRELWEIGAPALGNFRDGPLDQFEEKTPTWDWLHNTIRQVQNIAPYYLKLHSDNVYHFGAVPPFNHASSTATLVTNLAEGEWVVGDFTHEDGSRWALIVNRSLKHSQVCTPSFSIQTTKVEYASAITGKMEPYAAIYFWLAPGQGVLLKLTPK
jgi:hypothetical protein